MTISISIFQAFGNQSLSYEHMIFNEKTWKHKYDKKYEYKIIITLFPFQNYKV